MNSNFLKGLFLVALGVAVGVGYFMFQGSTLSLNGSGSGAEAFVGQTFPPILFFDSKASPASYDKGCHDLKWSSLNVTSCTTSWRPTVTVSGAEKVCQGKVDTEGVRSVGSNIGEVAYTITCSGSAGSVSRTIKVKN